MSLNKGYMFIPLTPSPSICLGGSGVSDHHRRPKVKSKGTKVSGTRKVRSLDGESGDVSPTGS